MASDLMGVADDTRGAELSEDICFSLSNHFIQPFREEIDSRNEYKTPVINLFIDCSLFGMTSNFNINKTYLIATIIYTTLR